jgi:pyruvate dehydrogenase E1 component beta subunit
MSASEGTATTVSIAQALNQALRDAMLADDAVFLLGEDIADAEGGGVFKITQGLSSEFGVERVRSTPISEQAIVGAAIGAALGGYRPVAEIMLMNFLTVAMDQIVNHAAKLRYMSGGQVSVPITIRTTTGAGAGFAGQHSDMLEAWFAHVPGLKVAAPSNTLDYYGLLRACIEDENPCLFIENTLSYAIRGPLPDSAGHVPLGKARVARAGKDLTLVSYGACLSLCHQAADALAMDGYDVEILDLRTIAPLDREGILASVAKTKAAIVVHEAVTPFGVGAEVSSVIHESLFGALKHHVVRIGAKATPVPFAQPLEQAYLASAEEIVRAASEIL